MINVLLLFYIIQDAMSLIRKAEHEERRLFIENTVVDAQNQQASAQVPKSKVPPAPLLLCRTDMSMVFKPAPFDPEDGRKVSPCIP